jgi:hypothetical protein
VEVHETTERIEHAEHAMHQEKKRAALLIIVLAVALAIIEAAGKEAQFASVAHNILASDTYAFFQAKTIRTTFLHAAIETVDALIPAGQRGEQVEKVTTSWKNTVDRLDSEPSTGEGRKELLERARVFEEQRDEEEHAYHHFEFAAAGLQLAIVVASAAVITELALLEIVSAGIGVASVVLGVFGWLVPSFLHL